MAMIRKISITLGTALVLLVLVVLLTYFTSSKQLLAQLDAASKIVQTSAGPVQYALSGDGGPVILFLHGTPGGFDHSPFFTSVGLEDYRLLSPSRPGYLDTPLESGKTPAEQARLYAAMLDALGINDVIVWGVSGGGPSALAFAAMYPQRTRALVGLEILSQSSSEPLEIPAVMRSDLVSWLLLSLATNLGGGKAALGMLPEIDAERIVGSPDGLDRVQRWLWTIWPVSRRLAGWQNDSTQFMSLDLPIHRITAPTLILNGTVDEAVSHESASRLASLIPGARLYTVEGGSHAMLLSHKEILSNEIRTFLAQSLRQ